MDMEFPDLDELQWLEANSHTHYPDDNDDDNFEEAYLEEHFTAEFQSEDKEKQSDPSNVEHQLHSSPETINRDGNLSSGKKRHRSKTPELELEDEIKVARVCADRNVERCNTHREPITECNDVIEIESECLSRFASEIDGDCIPVTAPSGCGGGERVYAKLEKHLFSEKNGKVHKFNQHINSGLLAEPVSLMLQKAEQDALRKALWASSDDQSPIVSHESPVVTEELWVNKYAPRSFTELLSDEQTNREVLLWLKRWDPIVFGTDIRNTDVEVLSALRRHSALPLHQKHSDVSSLRNLRGPRFSKNYMGSFSKNYTGSSFSKNYKGPSMSDREDVRSKSGEALNNKKLHGSGPPDQKVLLLCGPPGLGKTTLAHVAAKHCGYHVLEINASDDRSATVLETKILDAVQMNSVMADSKPKCLVIDEIDGAMGDGKGAVEILLKMVGGETKSSARKEGSNSGEQHGRKSLKKERKAVSLSRPVICICNDLYAPALRPLRRIAKVHVFAQPTTSRVVNRLKYICNKEGLKTSSIALTALAEYTECDIRSCLNTLQFLHKKRESLNLVSLSSQVIGQKDITRSVFDVWKELFQKRKVKQRPNSQVTQRKTYEAHDSLHSLISNRGDYELILDGIHENYLQLHYHDPLLHKTVHCLNALGVSDLLQQYVMRSHNMSLLAYYPSITIKIHHLLASIERPTIEWPKSFQRYRTLLTENIEILRSWQSSLGPCISRHLSVDSFVKDTVSPFLHILSPVDLRPVAWHLLSDKEKHDLTQLVSTMVSYTITYKNAKPDQLAHNLTHEGMMDASQLYLDPPVQGFVCFKDYKPGHHELTSAVKQVVVHEVGKQKIVRESMASSMNSGDSSGQQTSAVGSKLKGKLQSQNDAFVGISKERPWKPSETDSCEASLIGCSSPVGSDMTSADGRTSTDVEKSKSIGGVKKAPVGPFNFFDRFRKLNQKGVLDAGRAEYVATAERDGRALIFKFNEGFTNAVKRPVRIREFLL